MSKSNKGFAKTIEAQIKELKENAEIHADTHHIGFKTPTLPKGISTESLQSHVDYINQTSLAVEAATSQIAHEQFPETKHESWDGRLELFPGLTFNSDTHLREVVGDATIFGGTQTFVDHPHSQEMVDWYSAFRDRNNELATKLFD
jgi:hypothetical protein